MRAPEILAAVTTPFDAAGALDVGATRRLFSRLEPLLDGVFAAGTTGEFPSLSPSEHAQICEIALDVFGPQRVVIHVGSPSLRQSLQLAREAKALGAIRCAAITPYYLPATPEGIAAYWGAIVDDWGGEVYGYVFPDVAVTDLMPEDLPRVLSSGIVGLKVSASAAGRVPEYLANAPAGFKLWSGNDADLPAVLAAGGMGTVSGVSSALPQPWADYRDAVRDGDASARDAAQSVIEAVVPVLGPSIAHLKTALDLQGEPGGPCRMSIDPPTDETRELIAQAVSLGTR